MRESAYAVSKSDNGRRLEQNSWRLHISPPASQRHTSVVGTPQQKPTRFPSEGSTRAQTGPELKRFGARETGLPKRLRSLSFSDSSFRPMHYLGCLGLPLVESLTPAI